MVSEIIAAFPASATDILGHALGSSFTEKVLVHGCWCAQLNSDYADSGSTLGGQPVDGLDKICKQWKAARSCNDNHHGGTCFDSAIETYSFDEDSAACSGNLDCANDTCAIDLYYSTLVKDFMGEYTFPDDPFECVRGFGTATVEKSCTGQLPGELYLVPAASGAAAVSPIGISNGDSPTDIETGTQSPLTS